MEKILLLMGTNIGNLKVNLLTALQELKKRKIKIVKKSKMYKTKPWGYEEQPDFLNMALEIACDYKPLELLSVLKRVESDIGGIRSDHRWGPRTIDIDILFYGSQIVNTDRLIIPHKEFFNRPFAIKLLAEIAPDFMPPLSGKTIKDYLKGVGSEGIEIYCD